MFLSQKKAAVAAKGGKAQAKKKSGSKFVIDCTTAETDSILDCANFVRAPTSPVLSLPSHVHRRPARVCSG